jgi:hypothetical protein
VHEEGWGLRMLVPEEEAMVGGWRVIKSRELRLARHEVRNWKDEKCSWPRRRGVDCIIIVSKMGLDNVTGLIWLCLGFSFGLLWTQHRIFGNLFTTLATYACLRMVLHGVASFFPDARPVSVCVCLFFQFCVCRLYFRGFQNLQFFNVPKMHFYG